MNAKTELIKHIEDRHVKYVQIFRSVGYDCDRETIEGNIIDVLPKLEFDYDSGYGSQLLFGVIWYHDGSWSDRGEYDGSEWWEHRECPPLPDSALKYSLK